MNGDHLLKEIVPLGQTGLHLNIYSVLDLIKWEKTLSNRCMEYSTCTTDLISSICKSRQVGGQGDSGGLVSLYGKVCLTCTSYRGSIFSRA
jgi:hypothetical protein